jgi:transcriptional regulator with XRE-family HTH domain
VGATSHDQMYDAFGAYVRSQRHLAQLTLRQAAELASISNPYLSQIEHGLARPSIAVISALAEALSVSAETLLLRAAGIGSPDAAEPLCRPEDSIRRDLRLDEGQKRALLAVLASFLGSSSGAAPAQSEPVGARTARRRPSQQPLPLDQQPLGPPVIDEEGADHA